MQSVIPSFAAGAVPRASGRAALAIAIAGAALAGCISAGSVAALNSIAQYRPVSSLSYDGYVENRLDDSHYEVTAQGSVTTSLERLRSITLARAGEIGVEQKRAYFRIESEKQGFGCLAKGPPGYKTVMTGRPVVVITVAYANTPMSPRDFESAETFRTNKAAIDAEDATSAAKQAAVEAVWAGCKVGSTINR